MPKAKNQQMLPVSKKELVCSILEKLSMGQDFFSSMYVRDQNWLIKNPKKGLYLIAKAIEKRTLLNDLLKNRIPTVPRHLKSNRRAPDIALSFFTHNEIMLKWDKKTLWWMHASTTRALTNLIIKIITNREEIFSYLDSQ